MKILFVAFPFSIHTARWIGQLSDTGWDIHLFSSMDGSPHPELKGITFHVNFFEQPNSTAHVKTQSVQLDRFSFLPGVSTRKVLGKFMRVTGLQKSRAEQLEQVIRKIKPDIIHSLETQHSGYLLDEVKRKWKADFPYWIHSNWGIDLHFFGRLKAHQPKIKSTLSHINIFIAEGERDKKLAASFGFKGQAYIFPGGGGYKTVERVLSPASQRRKIMVKGTQDMVRRGTVALRALQRCIDLLQPYDIILYSSNEITRASAELFESATGKTITIQHETSHERILELNSESRLNICINMSDGLPNAMLEAMSMGAFPIQSNTSMADEWLEDGITGMLVPPEDPDIIEQAIRTALTNDDLVDRAAIINSKKIREGMGYEQIKKAVVDLYSSIPDSKTEKV